MCYSLSASAQHPHCVQEINGTIYNDQINYDSLNVFFEKNLAQYLSKKKQTKASELIYTIPVVVHIIHNDPFHSPGNLGSSNISDAQILSQIDVLNTDFRRKNSDTSQTPEQYKPLAADTKIEFCLASRDPKGNSTNGITRHYHSKDSWNVYNSSEYKQLRSISYWPANQYLNIWVTSLSSNVLGIATFPANSSEPGLPSNTPQYDGVVLHHSAFGNQTGTANGHQFAYGRTAVHEVGHWLGLLHTFQGGCLGNGDYCQDTPPQSHSTSGCPSTASISCSSRNMIENYMDYTNDLCLNLFTQNQKERMRAVLESSPEKKDLLSSPGCCGGEQTVSLPFSETFEENDLANSLWENTSTRPDFQWHDEHFGYHSASSVSIACQGTNQDTSYLTSHIINFRGTHTPTLIFQLYGTQLNANHKIRISHEKACSNTWITVKELDINTLHNDWHAYHIQIPALRGAFSGKIRFEVIGNNEGQFYLDDIRIINEPAKPQFNMFPNPAQNEVTISFTHQNKANATVIIYNTLGTLINTYEIPLSYSQDFKISTKNLANGMYLVRFITENKQETKRLVVDNP